MKNHILPALKLTLALLVVFAFGYTIIIRGFAYFSPSSGDGDVVKKNGKVVGFKNIGQAFTKDKYFWGRPSAVNYNAAGSAGSNKAASNPDYFKSLKANIDTFLVHNPRVERSAIPVELVTSSGSGLDPDISPASAYIQVPRIVKERHISEEKVRKLIDDLIVRPLFGPNKINVLELNVALDELK